MGPQDPHAFGKGTGAYVEHEQGFFHNVRIHFIAGLQRRALPDHILQIPVALGLQFRLHEGDAFPLCFAGGKEGFVVFAEGVDRL